MKRIFIGLPIPDHIKSLLSECIVHLDNVKWVKEENLHITLVFIGDIDLPTQKELHQVLEKIKLDPMSIKISGISHFGERVLFAKIEPVDEINHLQKKISTAIRQVPIKIDHRKFRAHITLARMKNIGEERVISLLKKNNFLKSEPFEINEFIMYSSYLSPKGPTYHEEMSYK